MKYEAPYGVSDPNASYINGNPATGTMGSIPPAASIENPQREIVNFETDSGLTPTDADLHQLSKSVQNGHVNYCEDQGTPNFIAITPTPAVAAYQGGLHFRIKIANNNTGPTKLNVSNVGFSSLVHSSNQSELGAGELFAGMIIEVTFDDAKWQLLSGGGGGGGLIFMTAPRTLYVNASTGNDTTLDGTQPTVDVTNKHGPFQTIQKALQVMTTYNLAGFQFSIVVADGTYTGPVNLPLPNGSGLVLLSGNSAAPQNCLITSSAGTAVRGWSGGSYNVDGFSLQCTGTVPGDGGCGIGLSNGFFNLFTLRFLGCLSSHIASYNSALTIANGLITIAGSASAHIATSNLGQFSTASTPPPLTIVTPVSFGSAFMLAGALSVLTGVYSSITGAANVSGQKFNASYNGVINSGGSGVNYFPGTVAGVTSTGGQYL